MNIRSDFVVSLYDKKRYACSTCHEKGHNKATCPLGKKGEEDFESRMAVYLVDSISDANMVAEEEHYLEDADVANWHAYLDEQIQECFKQAFVLSNYKPRN